MEHRDKPDRTLRQLIRAYTIYVTIGVALVANTCHLRVCSGVNQALLAARTPFLAHFVLWIFILKRWETFNPTWFAFVLAPEVAVIAIALGWCEIATHGFKERFRWRTASDD